MPVWQTLYAELKDKGFMVVAVAEESRGAQHARPWIEEAKSDYWQLIDVEHVAHSQRGADHDLKIAAGLGQKGLLGGLTGRLGGPGRLFVAHAAHDPAR